MISKVYFLTFLIVGVALSKKVVLEEDLELDDEEPQIRGKGY
jgi:hypothetical protein